jgi:hypothetical protein
MSSLGRRTLGPLVVLVGVLLAAAAAGTATAVPSGREAPPDLRILVPTGLISVGVDPQSGVRELRFTHITADVGAGPFEIDPSYNPRTGISTFVQALYRVAGPGVWSLARRVPLAAVGEFRPPTDYQFPLTAFTLSRVTGDGSPGVVVANSPKRDYCITGDTMLSGVPHTPDQTFISPSNCDDPTKPLGWSVGWGDEYDQTDAGQPISLRGVPNGTYVLHAVVDPRHVFIESDAANDVTDTTLRIAGDSVTVLGQRNPRVIPPRATITSPRAGAGVSGAVTLQASASASPPAVVRSVQFLLDGRPLGRPLEHAPFRTQWMTAAAGAGAHRLSAEVTDSRGTLGTARPVRVIVRPAPPLTVRLVRWRRGILTLAVAGVPDGAIVRVKLGFGHGRARSFDERGRRLRIRTARPRTVVLTVLAGGHQVGGALTLNLYLRPAISISNPTRGETVSGIVPVAAQAVGGVPVAYVQFAVDGRRLGPTIRKPPYATEWDTRRESRGRHALSARVVDVSGKSARATLTLRVQNPAPRMTCFVMQADLNARGQGSVTTRPFHTALRGETLLAFLSADGPPQSRAQAATVSGAGLRWKLVKRADLSYGDSEIWSATAPRIMIAARVTATLRQSSYNESLTVVAMEGSDGTGEAAAAGGVRASPALSLRTLSSKSLVFAVGNDWDQAVARSLPTGWVMLDQWMNIDTGDTFWSQYTNQPTARAHTRIRVASGGPITDHWNLAAVELIGDGD